MYGNDAEVRHSYKNKKKEQAPRCGDHNSLVVDDYLEKSLTL
jgi:hypothetical protein